MSTTRPEQPANSLATKSAGRPADKELPGLTDQINSFNEENVAHENLYSDARQAADHVEQAENEAARLDATWASADLYYRAIQAEYPERPSPRPRQLMLASGTLSLDGVACFFAAEALSGGPDATLAWAGLFLALLGAGELTLDLYRETHPVLWRWTAVALGAFIGLLGILRFWFLATVGTEGLVTSLAGAALFTMATAGFVIIGYRALRVAETGKAWRARRAARACREAASAAHRKAERLKIRRDRLARAYLGRIRTRLIKNCPEGYLSNLEQAILTHLTGEDQS